METAQNFLPRQTSPDLLEIEPGRILVCSRVTIAYLSGLEANIQRLPRPGRSHAPSSPIAVTQGHTAGSSTIPFPLLFETIFARRKEVVALRVLRQRSNIGREIASWTCLSPLCHIKTAYRRKLKKLSAPLIMILLQKEPLKAQGRKTLQNATAFLVVFRVY